MQQADHQVQRHDHPEVDGVDADLGDDRHQHRHQDGDGGDGLQEAADDQQQDVDQQQDDVAVAGVG